MDTPSGGHWSSNPPDNWLHYRSSLGWLRNAISMRKGRLTMAKLIYSAITSLDGYEGELTPRAMSSDM